MARSTGTTSLVMLLTLASSGCQTYDSLAPQRTRPPVGYLEHRGSRYQVRDLLDPAYRAQSSDPFLKDFSPDTCFADRASIEPMSRIDSHRLLSARIALDASRP